MPRLLHHRLALQTSGSFCCHDITLIAAHALGLQATLVTNNLKEFERVPGLLLDNWIPSA
jgi:tRNA(fMet)-specific endonuclease VapC